MGFPEDQLPGTAGSVKTVTIEINGKRFEACNGGSPFEFSMGVLFSRTANRRKRSTSIPKPSFMAGPSSWTAGG
ncbi:MAG TPA: hypothetical protein DCS07_08260 [Bdellovibrionales bacterium]|nr:MAG: hypothetical protein A2Z97_00430 [Bdellovibrionales bacterium GWB1_52_6]OFZ03235.1 MAG: hypothetical protein A2X97_09920 [Bdellovibrionales bacterium GWA1_52_35]OFZ38248.1 MAG: hypothetical protein A2070_05080 [Bdellovibrionales bacterium GWC1_52_8]HAR42609.1 hypothetical protein [Bdellovibrionales bacterium]HCM40583.1 hypothetical protein [Bdellovibrionales bacterium]